MPRRPVWGGELGQLLFTKVGIGEMRDDNLFLSPEILVAGVGGGVSYRLKLRGRKPNSDLLVLSFRVY